MTHLIIVVVAALTVGTVTHLLTATYRAARLLDRDETLGSDAYREIQRERLRDLQATWKRN